MKVHKLLHLVKVGFLSLLQQKLRSALSILGIVCGVMAVLTMISAGEGAKHELMKQIEQLGTKNIFIRQNLMTNNQKYSASKQLSSGLTINDVNRIRKGLNHLENIAYLKDLKTDVVGLDTRTTPQVVSCSPNYDDIMGIQIGYGRFLSDSDLSRQKMVCVVGHNIYSYLKNKGENSFYIRMEDKLFRVVGRLKRFERYENSFKKAAVSIRDYNEMIFIPTGLENILTSNNSGRDLPKMPEERRVSEIIVKVDKTDAVIHSGRVIKRVLNVAHNHVKDYTVVIPKELLNQARDTQKTFNLVLGTIAGISLLVGGIGIMNIMLATVSERTREIGIRRAVGATGRDIVCHFLTESVILTLIGGCVGILFGIGAAHLISGAAGWQTRITVVSIIAPVVMSILAGVFFGLYPAIKASRMDPIKALRYE